MTEITKSEKFKMIDEDGFVCYHCMSCRKPVLEEFYQSDDDMQHPICNSCNWSATINMTEWKDLLNALVSLDPNKPEDAILYNEIMDLTKELACFE